MSWAQRRAQREWDLTDQQWALECAQERWFPFADESGHDLCDVVEQIVPACDERQGLCFGFDRDRLLDEVRD